MEKLITSKILTIKKEGFEVNFFTDILTGILALDFPA
jgi:hypothetical protein